MPLLVFLRFVIPTTRGARSKNLLLAEVRGRTPKAGSRKPNSFPQRRHLHRRQRRLKSLVPHLQPRPIDRLLQILASQHPKRMRHARFLRRLPNPPRDFIHDHVIVRRIPAQQAAETNNGVIFFRQRQSPRRQRNLKRPRHPHDLDVILLALPNETARRKRSTAAAR